MAKASVKQIGTRKVTKIVEVDAPAEEVTLTMTKREAAYVYMILGKVLNNKREWQMEQCHPVFGVLFDVFRGVEKPDTGNAAFNYESLPLGVRDWVASQ